MYRFFVGHFRCSWNFITHFQIWNPKTRAKFPIKNHLVNINRIVLFYLILYIY